MLSAMRSQPVAAMKLDQPRSTRNVCPLGLGMSNEEEDIVGMRHYCYGEGTVLKDVWGSITSELVFIL